MHTPNHHTHTLSRSLSVNTAHTARTIVITRLSGNKKKILQKENIFITLDRRWRRPDSSQDSAVRWKTSKHGVGWWKIHVNSDPVRLTNYQQTRSIWREECWVGWIREKRGGERRDLGNHWIWLESPNLRESRPLWPHTHTHTHTHSSPQERKHGEINTVRSINIWKFTQFSPFWLCTPPQQTWNETIMMCFKCRL